MKPYYENQSISIYRTDCREFMSGCADKQFDLAIADPPYLDGPNKLGYYGGRIPVSQFLEEIAPVAFNSPSM